MGFKPDVLRARGDRYFNRTSRAMRYLVKARKSKDPEEAESCLKSAFFELDQAVNRFYVYWGATTKSPHLNNYPEATLKGQHEAYKNIKQVALRARAIAEKKGIKQLTQGFDEFLGVLLTDSKRYGFREPPYSTRKDWEDPYRKLADKYELLTKKKAA
ncbi:MAG: hypothetical protein NTX24_04880 [Candidatus Pacearchaeota archaeon]|nr:hypothetical protein [Candidatus Pacearchaeota archaeon]